MNDSYSHPYWLDEPLITGERQVLPRGGSVVVIGAGLSGVSCGYFLQKQGFEDVVIVDFVPEVAASFRNAGHILYGTVESMKAMVELHGEKKARELWSFSIDICEQVKHTLHELGADADYHQDGYLVISVNEAEDLECRDSVKLLNSMGFQSDYVDAETVRSLGFKNTFGARFEKGSAQAHPTKFRNAVLKAFLEAGGRYYSGVEVTRLEENADGVVIETPRGTFQADAVVIAANAYSPLFSDFFASRRLVEPFRGQIITSKPLKQKFKVGYPHSFDHGYEYALVTPDNRLLIGGWRNHSSTREVGLYSIEVNRHIEAGLQQFVENHYVLEEPIEWEYSWSGIMAASQTGLPFIGNTTSQRIYACCAYTGHGFSWAHGSAKLLADIIAGANVPEVAGYFNPKSVV